MNEFDNWGESIFLGHPYWAPSPTLQTTFNQAPSILNPWSLLNPEFRKAAEYMLATSSGAFFIIKGSMWEDVLAEQVAGGRVCVIDFDTAIKKMVLPKHFLLLDNTEDLHGFGRDILATFGGFLPNIVLMRHVHTLAVHLRYFDALANTVRSAARERDTLFTVLGFDSYSQAIIADILYILVDEVDTVAKKLFHPGDLPHLYPISRLEKIDGYFLVCNAEGTSHYMREFLVKHSGCNFCFFHGEKGIRPNSCFLRNNLLFFHAGGHGVSRSQYPVGAILSYFGMSRNPIDLFHPNTLSNHGFAHDREQLRKTVSLFRDFFLWNDVYLGACEDWVLEEFMKNPNFDLLLCNRDFRDVLVSYVTANNVAKMRYGGIDFNECFMKHLRALRDCVGSAPVSMGKADHSELFAAPLRILDFLMKCRNLPNAAFIRFEETYSDPIQAYMKPFAKLGYDTDPFWVEPAIQNLVRTLIANIPAGYRPQGQALANLPKVISGRPGGWRERFGPEAKKLFKECASGCEYLKAFQYEQDDSW